MTEILQMKGLEKEMDSVFKSEEEYLRFREEFTAELEPILDEQRKARAKSEEDLRRKIVF